MNYRNIAALASVLLLTAATSGLDQITARGRALYAYDDAAAHASDAAQAIATAQPSEGFEYVGQLQNGSWVFDFGTLSADRSTFALAYRVTQVGRTHRFDAAKIPAGTSAPPGDLNEARAVSVAKADFGLVNRPYNYAVLPGDDGRMFVYIYPAQTDAKVHPLGGDTRYLMSPDGAQIVEKHQMHRAILEIGNQSPAGMTPVAAFHNDIFSDMPEDTDVFDAMISHRPEYVSANGNIFEISEDGSIRAVSRQ